MQTQYKLLYRYINQSTNIAVTDEADYEKTEVFYNYEHKINLTTSQLAAFNNKKYDLKYKLDGIEDGVYQAQMSSIADREREDIITKNMDNNEKANNLYVYAGTTKVFHEQYIPEQLGYKVSKWENVPTLQIPSDSNDFSKHFVMQNGHALGVDNAYLVCKPQFVTKYYNHSTNGQTKDCFINLSTHDLHNYGYKNNYKFFNKNIAINHDELRAILDAEMSFNYADSLVPEDVALYNEQYITPSGFETCTDIRTGDEFLVTEKHYSDSTPPTIYKFFFYDNQDNPGVLPDDLGVVPQDFYGSDSIRYVGYKITDLQEKGFMQYGPYIKVDTTNIIRKVIPEHYEKNGDGPYYIKDNYKKIEQSPWMLHSIYNSLTDALAKANEITKMIGIDNVLLIKNVPLKQDTKIN